MVITGQFKKRFTVQFIHDNIPTRKTINMNATNNTYKSNFFYTKPLATQPLTEVNIQKATDPNKNSIIYINNLVPATVGEASLANTLPSPVKLVSKQGVITCAAINITVAAGVVAGCILLHPALLGILMGAALFLACFTGSFLIGQIVDQVTFFIKSKKLDKKWDDIAMDTIINLRQTIQQGDVPVPARAAEINRMVERAKEQKVPAFLQQRHMQQLKKTLKLFFPSAVEINNCSGLEIDLEKGMLRLCPDSVYNQNKNISSTKKSKILHLKPQHSFGVTIP